MLVFLGALKPEIADVVHLQQYWTYGDVCRLALKVEKQLKSRGKPGGSRFITSGRSPPIQTNKTPNPKGDIPTSTNSNPAGPRVLRCFRCQGVGHIARECPNKQLVTLVEDLAPVYDTKMKRRVMGTRLK